MRIRWSRLVPLRIQRPRGLALWGLLVMALSLLVSAVEVRPSLAARLEQDGAGADPAEVSAAPDLIITGITLTPANPGAGGTADIEVVVKNQGDATATGGFNLYLYVEPTDDPPTQTTTYTTIGGYFLPLAAGRTFRYTRTGQVFQNTPPKVYAWVDPPWDNRVVESDENNNLFPKPVSVDAFENDDTCANAKEATANGPVQDRNLQRHPDPDVDWIKFTGASGVTYKAEAIPVGADAAVTLELRGTCEGPASFGGGARIEFTAPADGTFYIKVSPNRLDYGPDNAYQFKVTSDTGCSNVLEANDTCSLSGDLPLAVAQTHTFCKAGDADWMRFSVTAGAQYKIVSTNVGAKANTRLGLFMSCADATDTSSGQILEFTAPEAGFLYLKAEPVNATVFGAGTDYTVKVERLGADGCTEDSFEQNDNSADAKSITTDGTKQTHNACPAADADWVKFSATSGITYNIETLNLAASADTVLCLHASNGDKIVCDDDSGAGKGSRLIWNPTISGNYLLHIKDASATVAGDMAKYDLRIAQGLCQTDASEDDNSRDKARVVSPGGTPTSHNFCPGEDTDWVAFNATGGASYMVETLNPGPDADTIIELYDANGAMVAQNDDHTPGTSSQVAFAPAATGNYFARVRQYNPSNLGAGTEYDIRVQQGTPTPTPTPSVTPTPTPTPTPNPSSVRTLILVNRAKLAQLYSDSEAAQVMDKLASLAQHDKVRGEIIRLDNNAEVSAAYAAWANDQASVEKANQVTTAIRNVVATYLQQRSGIEYLVLVGDDRALPMRRILDKTPRSSESSYKFTDVSNSTGAALKGNYFLSDDYIADREPTVQQGTELFIPDLAAGRLIESPAEIMGQIDAFLANPVTTVDNILVTGYDFVQDVATGDCEDWKTDFGATKVDCSLIGENWTGQAFRALQLRITAPFKVQSISGHASHYAEGAPSGNSIIAQEIANSALDLSGGLIYTPGCHAGLNVPPTNTNNPMDLPQAFASKRANYIGNTGYGWGMRSSIGLTEKVIRLYTRALLKGLQSSMGKALVTAKTLYHQQDTDFSGYDEKVMQQMIFYGLPMYELESGSALDPEDPFPGVDFTPDVPENPLGSDDILTGTISVDFSEALNLALSETGDGDYYSLNGSIHAVPGQPMQPLHFGDVTAPELPAHGALLLNATFKAPTTFDPLVAIPYNEYETANLEPELENPLALYPPMPVSVQQLNGKASLVTQLGQYDASTGKLSLLETLDVELYYSTSTDQISPEATVIDALVRLGGNRVEMKVGAVDASGIERVLVSYIEDINLAANQLKSVDLQYDAAAQKWIGTFQGSLNSRYLVQIVDKAGNITTATNKGQYYKPGRVLMSAGSQVYLPRMVR